MDGFRHINQPDFDRERDGAVEAIRRTWSSQTVDLRRAYNEGYKQALRDWSIWKDGEQLVGCMQRPIKEIMEEVDKIDKG